MIIFLVCEVCLIVNIFSTGIPKRKLPFSPTTKFEKEILLNDSEFFNN